MKEKNSMTIKIRIPTKLFRKLKSRASKYHDGNMSEMIRQAIDEYKIRKAPIKGPSIE